MYLFRSTNFTKQKFTRSIQEKKKLFMEEQNNTLSISLSMFRSHTAVSKGKIVKALNEVIIPRTKNEIPVN